MVKIFAGYENKTGQENVKQQEKQRKKMKR